MTVTLVSSACWWQSLQLPLGGGGESGTQRENARLILNDCQLRSVTAIDSSVPCSLSAAFPWGSSCRRFWGALPASECWACGPRRPREPGTGRPAPLLLSEPGRRRDEGLRTRTLSGRRAHGPPREGPPQPSERGTPRPRACLSPGGSWTSSWRRLSYQGQRVPAPRPPAPSCCPSSRTCAVRCAVSAGPGTPRGRDTSPRPAKEAWVPGECPRGLGGGG